jgi:hypothetical protein
MLLLWTWANWQGRWLIPDFDKGNELFVGDWSRLRGMINYTAFTERGQVRWTQNRLCNDIVVLIQAQCARAEVSEARSFFSGKSGCEADVGEAGHMNQREK